MFDHADLLIVGAGFYGATIAERAAAAGKRVALIDRRSHIGGNAYTDIDNATGIERHVYGAHLFHTSNVKVWQYLNRFATFTDYRHKVYSVHEGNIYPLPFNLQTICQFYRKQLSPEQARALVRKDASEVDPNSATNLEEKAISLIGRPLYEAFVRSYTLKQWQTDPRELPENIITRLPVRYNFDNRYFMDMFEGLPTKGYTKIFDQMLSSERIDVRLGVDYFELRLQGIKLPKTIFTGPIDRYYDFAEGALGWRTVDFEWERPEVDDYQGTSVLNYADLAPPWTRIIEFKHFYPDREYGERQTLIAREYSRTATTRDEPYYPINTLADKEAYRRYRTRAEKESGVRFGGRLGTYRYLDMHQAIAAALHDSEDIIDWIEQRAPVVA